MNELKLGIVGLGNMGRVHANTILAGKIPRCRLAAVCDENPERLKAFESAAHFSDCAEMISSGKIDAILIATPHYSHTSIGIAALEAGLHVLVEKPISVHKADCQRLIAAHRSKKQVFAAMFNQRTDSFYQKIREMVREGTLGEIRRVTWTITNWFRSEAYYSSGGWRATWAGEGGGVLLNQCPHNLDIFQWIFGLPDQVRGFCQIGRHHDIEVEDDVTAYFEYKSGMTGVFITSTGEAPGVNRLEISGENGRLVYESGKLRFERNEIPMTEFSRTTEGSFDRPPLSIEEIPVKQKSEQHADIMRNFTNAVLDGEALVAPAAEGIHSVELGNAILLSSMLNETVVMPMSAQQYETHLKRLIVASPSKERLIKNNAPEMDLSQSFGR